MEKYILCCDWGTSSFRLKLVDRAKFHVVAEVQSADGVGGVFRSWQEQNEVSRFEYFNQTLLKHISLLADKSPDHEISAIPLIVSGMASSTLGMEEIPYASIPFATDGSMTSAKLYKSYNGKGVPMLLISGVKTYDDVMRGEEVQLIGLLNLPEVPFSDRVQNIFVFPGTHSKHILVRGDMLVDFQTFMTGEIYNIISEHSILKDSLIPQESGLIFKDANLTAFKRGVDASGESNLLHSLFTVRTNQLFGRHTKMENAFYLSGMLIGNEMRQLKCTPDCNIVICSGKNLFEQYRIAAESMNLADNLVFIQPEMIEQATVAGQIKIFNTLINTLNVQ